MKVGFLVSSVSREAGGLFQSVRGLAKAVMSESANVSVFGIADPNSALDVLHWQPLLVRTFEPQFRAWGYSNQLVSSFARRRSRHPVYPRFMEILLGCFTSMASADSPTLYCSCAWDAGTMGIAKCEMEKANCRAALPKSTFARARHACAHCAKPKRNPSVPTDCATRFA